VGTDDGDCVIAPAISLPTGRGPRLEALDWMLCRSIREKTCERRLSDKIKTQIRGNTKCEMRKTMNDER
jgi:hypothetical protein